MLCVMPSLSYIVVWCHDGLTSLQAWAAAERGNPAFLSAPAVPPIYGHVVSNKGADLAENDHFSCLGETSALFPFQVG